MTPPRGWPSRVFPAGAYPLSSAYGALVLLLFIAAALRQLL